MISLFFGIETYNWNLQQFAAAAYFCKQNGISCAIIKVYESTQGQWYGSIPGGYSAVKDVFNTLGVEVLPYGYFYGDTSVELPVVHNFLASDDKFCMNMEAPFNNKPDIVQSFAGGLKDHKGTLYVSTWANPVSQGWSKNIGILDPVVDVWMPEVYSDSLLKDMYSQFPKVKGKIEPTFHLLYTNYLQASIYPNISLWEWQLISQSQSFQNYVKQNEGEKVNTYPTNNRGMVANYLPISEFQPGKSEFMCGAFAVALNMRASNYNQANTFSAANLISWAENEYVKYAGSDSPSNMVGASIDDMHNMIKDTQSDPNGLHYWDLPISTSSKQEDDIANIKAALQHGYPVIATVSESSVFDLDLNANPYWWGASGNHIITWVGIASDGNLLAVDPANVIRGDGNLQTAKNVQPWPRRYDISRIDNQWATIIQNVWLPPIPNNTPQLWSPYTPTVSTDPIPQPTQNVTVIYDPNSKQLIYYTGVTAIYRIQL